MSVPRAMGVGAFTEICLVGEEAPDRGMHDVAGLDLVEIAQDLGNAEHAHREHREVDTIGQESEAESHPLLTGFNIDFDR